MLNGKQVQGWILKGMVCFPSLVLSVLLSLTDFSYGSFGLVLASELAVGHCGVWCRCVARVGFPLATLLSLVNVDCGVCSGVVLYLCCRGVGGTMLALSRIMVQCWLCRDCDICCKDGTMLALSS